MKFTKVIKSFVVAAWILLSALTTTAQNWEADIIRSINSPNNSSETWRITNNSVKPISAGLPFALLATGLIAKDEKLQSESLEMMGGLLLTVASTEGLKLIVNRKRPCQVYPEIYPDEYNDGKSFPSGHSSVAFFTAASLSMNHPKWYVIAPTFGWAFGVAYARLYYGQHNPTDLLGSFVVGTGSAWISHKTNKWLNRKKRSITTPVL
jgi:membrane-associated phospholipid phosphatase